MNLKDKATIVIYDTDIGLEVIAYCKDNMNIDYTCIVQERTDAYKYLQQKIEPTQVIIAVKDNSIRKSIADDIVGLELKNITFPNIVLTESLFTDAQSIGVGNIILMDSMVGVFTKIGDFNIIDIGVKVLPHSIIGSFNMVDNNIPRYKHIGDLT